MSKINQRNTLKNSYHLNMEYLEVITKKREKNCDKIKKCQDENKLLDSKIKSIEKVLGEMKDTAQQLNLFDPNDYKIFKTNESNGDAQEAIN